MRKGPLINRDYLGIVIEENNHLLSSKIDIPTDEILINELAAMLENSNRNVIDLQKAFIDKYPEKIYKDTYYDYIYPNNYMSAYVTGAYYPKLYSYVEYKDELKKKETAVTEDLLDSEEAEEELNEIKKRSYQEYKAEVEKRKNKIKDEVNKYKDRLKKRFFDSCTHFIHGHNYTETVKRTSNKFKDKLRMFSTEQVGWRGFEFPLNSEVTAKLLTNFGYGSAAYFYCNITYKGVEILPYSAAVNYYYVNWIDLIRYTRAYSKTRDSWEEVFDFVVEVGNMAKKSPQKFIDKWIIGEIKEMMEGLHAIMESPKKEFERYAKIRTEESIGLYSLVRDFSYSDKTEYKILPQEKVLAFKAEKISGSLHFLDNLNKLKGLDNKISMYINDIVQLNRSLKPELVQGIKSISDDLVRLNKILDSQSKKIRQLNILIRPYELECAKEAAIQEEKDPKNFSRYSFDRQFISEHKEYDRLRNRLNSAEEDKRNTQKDIKLRQKFKDELSANLQLIREQNIA